MNKKWEILKNGNFSWNQQWFHKIKAIRFDENSTFSRKKFNKKKGGNRKNCKFSWNQQRFHKANHFDGISTISRKNVIFWQFFCFSPQCLFSRRRRSIKHTAHLLVAAMIIWWLFASSLNNALEINRAEHQKKSDDDDQVEFKKELLATRSDVEEAASDPHDFFLASFGKSWFSLLPIDHEFNAKNLEAKRKNLQQDSSHHQKKLC